MKPLLEQGIDVDVTNNEGQTPLHLAASQELVEMVTFLLENHADVHATDNDGWDALMYAVSNGSPEVVKVLVEHGAEVNQAGYTPLMAAARRGYTDVVNVLLQYGADKHAQITREGSKYQGWTALEFAEAENHTEVAQLLKEAVQAPQNQYPETAAQPGQRYDIEKDIGEQLLKKFATTEFVALWGVLKEEGVPEKEIEALMNSEEFVTSSSEELLNLLEEWGPDMASLLPEEMPENMRQALENCRNTIRVEAQKRLAEIAEQGQQELQVSSTTGSLETTVDYSNTPGFLEHEGLVMSVAFSPDGMLLASGSRKGTIKLWQATDGSLVRTLNGDEDGVNPVAFSPDGKLLASGGQDNTIQCWLVGDGSLVQTLKGHQGFVTTVAFAPKAPLLASGSADATIKIWRTTDGSLVRTLKGHQQSVVTTVAFSPDGQILASGSLDGTVNLWKIMDGSLVRTLENDLVRSVAFSPHGNFLAVGNENMWGEINIWRVADGSLTRTLQHEGIVLAVAFCPTSDGLLASFSQKEIKLWQAFRGDLSVTIKGWEIVIQGASYTYQPGLRAAFTIAFSPNGQLLAAPLYNIKIWGLKIVRK